ncbi:SDR family oxidoreductase [Candidatus Zixiibacteriota bacterium]
MDLGLSGKVALVTGASAGLGYASARALAAEGATVMICSRDYQRITDAALAIGRDTGVEPLPLESDLTDASGIQQLVRKAVDEFNTIDILVSNAGGPPGGPFSVITAEQWDQAYNLTFQSTLHLCREVLPLMEGQGSGSIVVITSIAAKQPIPGLVTSNALRAGLNGLIKSIANEYGPMGIRANTIAPGYTLTERLDELAAEISDREGRSKEDIFNGWTASTPLRRLGEPREIGEAVAFLASARAAYITGQHLAVDGGTITGTMG